MGVWLILISHFGCSNFVAFVVNAGYIQALEFGIHERRFPFAFDDARFRYAEHKDAFSWTKAPGSRSSST